MNLLARSKRRIFAYNSPVSMRNGSAGLQGLVVKHLRENPTNGDVYVFLGRNGKQLKCLFWDRTGFVVVTKRLENGTFRFRSPSGKLELDEERLKLLLDGVSIAGTLLALS